MATWQTPKTDWSATSRFNIEDFNRIKNNIDIVMGYLSGMHDDIEIEDMGEDELNYDGFWDVKKFNAIEINVEQMARHLEGASVYKLTFYSNSPFIKSEELNRIENITLRYEEEVKGWLAGRIRLPMVVGRDKRLRF